MLFDHLCGGGEVNGTCTDPRLAGMPSTITRISRDLVYNALLAFTPAAWNQHRVWVCVCVSVCMFSTVLLGFSMLNKFQGQKNCLEIFLKTSNMRDRLVFLCQFVSGIGRESGVDSIKQCSRGVSAVHQAWGASESPAEDHFHVWAPNQPETQVPDTSLPIQHPWRKDKATYCPATSLPANATTTTSSDKLKTWCFYFGYSEPLRVNSITNRVWGWGGAGGGGGPARGGGGPAESACLLHPIRSCSCQIISPADIFRWKHAKKLPPTEHSGSGVKKQAQWNRSHTQREQKRETF